MSEPQLTVRRDIQSPPGGWRYTPPQTGVTIRGEFFSDLYQKVRSHLIANGFDDVDQEEIEDGACRETNPGGSWCGRRDPKPTAGAMPHLTLALAERFIMTIWETLKARKIVSRDEAHRRHDICMACPLATSIGGCTGCHGILKRVAKAMTNDPLPDDETKRYCAACGCQTQLKPWIPNSILDKTEKVRPLYHEACWRWEKNRVAGVD